MSIITKSITEQIYNIIKERILLQEYKVGSKIDMNEIARENEISIMPVRDALKKLSNQGLVENKSRVGFFVRSFNERETKNIMEVRRMYEIYCLDKHFANINKEKMESLYEEIKCMGEPDRKEFDRLDAEFHDLLIKASENEFLIKNYGQIKDLIVLFKHLDRERIRLANKEHCQLIEAILEGDKDKAIQKLEEHITNVTYSAGETLKKIKA